MPACWQDIPAMYSIKRKVTKATLTHLGQWSLRTTGTMGTTLASQEKIGVWVQAPGTLLRGSGGIIL